MGDFEDELEAINRTTQEMLEKSDRVRAVLMGVQLDSLLTKLLKEYLIPVSNRNETFLGGGETGATAGTRIEMALRVGLISPDWHHDLMLMNKIRDHFAHGVAGVRFSQEPFVTWCNAFLIGKHYWKGLPEDAKKTADGAASRFFATGVLLSSRLLLARKEVGRIPEVWKTFRQDSVSLE